MEQEEMQGRYREKSQYINGLIYFLPLCSISNSPGDRVARMGLATKCLFSFEEQKQQKDQDTQGSREPLRLKQGYFTVDPQVNIDDYLVNLRQWQSWKTKTIQSDVPCPIVKKRIIHSAYPRGHWFSAGQNTMYNC